MHDIVIVLMGSDLSMICFFYISGPLLYYDEGMNATVVIGIVSFGFGCASQYTPGYYARVNQVLPWITDVINTSDKCPPPVTSTKSFKDKSSTQSSISSSASPTLDSVSSKLLTNSLKNLQHLLILFLVSRMQVVSYCCYLIFCIFIVRIFSNQQKSSLIIL